jgi:hypothetical protein
MLGLHFAIVGTEPYNGESNRLFAVFWEARLMSSAGSITHWLRQLQAGEPAAAQPLWECYFQRLAALARKRLLGSPRRAADEEDVALSAFDSFCRGAERGRFPQLVDRSDLWQLLVLLTARKAARLKLHERRQKRGGGKVLTEADLPAADAAAEEPALARSASGCWTTSTTPSCGRLPCGRWKGTRPKRLPRSWPVRRGRSSGGWNASGGSGLRRRRQHERQALARPRDVAAIPS